MDVRITVRRATIGQSFIDLIEERVAKLGRFEPRLQAVSVLVDEDRGRFVLEARAEVPAAPPMIARGEAATERSALDLALQKLRRQLRRRRARRVDHQAPPAGAVKAD
jgi:ribosomal subunit interface protein